MLPGSIISLPFRPGTLLSLGPGTTLPAVGEFIAGNRLAGVCSAKSSSLSTVSTPTATRVSSEGVSSGPSCTTLLEHLEITGTTLLDRRTRREVPSFSLTKSVIFSVFVGNAVAQNS